MKKVILSLFAMLVIVTSCDKNSDLEPKVPCDASVVVMDDVDLNNCSYYHQRNRIRIESEGEWELRFSADWISAQQTKGIGADTVSLMIAENEGPSSREAAVYIVDAKGALSEPYKIKQHTVAEMDDNSGDDIVYDNGTWLIYTAEGLVQFGDKDEDSRAILMNDIDLDGYNWYPMFSSDDFEGSFVGNHKTIHNMTVVDLGGVSRRGLFARMEDAYICDLTLENVNIYAGPGNNSSKCIGGVAGEAESSSFVNCRVYGKISAGENQNDEDAITKGGIIGGIVGEADCSTIIYCANYAEVIGGRLVGGIVGTTYVSSIVGCYNVGEISGSGITGGIVGYIGGIIVGTEYSYVRSCYSIGAITGKDYVGAIGGDENNVGGRDLIAEDCYYDNYHRAFGDTDDYDDDGDDLWRDAERREGTINTQQTVEDLNYGLDQLLKYPSPYDSSNAHVWLLIQKLTSKSITKFKVGPDGHPVLDNAVAK